MESTLKKVVNIGIGAVKSIQENYGDRFKDWEDKLEKHLGDLENKGAKAEDSISNKIKQGVDEFLDFVNKYQTETHPEAESPKKKPAKKAKAKKTE